MPEFAVNKNTNAVTAAAVPLLLDVQSDLFSHLKVTTMSQSDPHAKDSLYTFTRRACETFDA
jgi:hypothetical protein